MPGLQPILACILLFVIRLAVHLGRLLVADRKSGPVGFSPSAGGCHSVASYSSRAMTLLVGGELTADRSAGTGCPGLGTLSRYGADVAHPAIAAVYAG